MISIGFVDIGLTPVGSVSPTASPLVGPEAVTKLTWQRVPSNYFSCRISKIPAVASLTVDGITIARIKRRRHRSRVSHRLFPKKRFDCASVFGGPGAGQQLTVGFTFLRNRRTSYFHEGLREHP